MGCRIALCLMGTGTFDKIDFLIILSQKPESESYFVKTVKIIIWMVFVKKIILFQDYYYGSVYSDFNNESAS